MDKQTKTVTITRSCRQMIDGKVQTLQEGKFVELPIVDANYLIALNKAVEGAVKVEAKTEAKKEK
jgi:hypothetical protein